MWDVFFKIAFYGGVGIILIAAICWYVSSLYAALTGKGEVVIAPFEVIRMNGELDKTRGVALAHMLQAQLREIERDIETAQTQLMGQPPQGRAAPLEEGAIQLAGALPFTRIPIPAVLIQGVGLHTKLLDPAEVKVSVAGVEVGGVFSWLQRQLVNQRTVIFTVYEKKQSVRVAGTLQALNLKNDALTLDVKAEEGEDSVPLDRVIESAAY